MGVNFPIKYKGKGYWTYKDLCKSLKISYEVFIKYKEKGLSISQAVKKTEQDIQSKKNEQELREERSTTRGSHFESKKEKEAKQSRYSLTYRDKIFATKKALYKFIGVSERSIIFKMDKGYTFEEALDFYYNKKRGKEILYKGKNYVDLKALCLDLGLNISSVKYIVNKGNSIETALNIALVLKSREHPIKYRAILYWNLEHLTKELKLPLPSINKLLKEGSPLIDAIDKVMNEKENKKNARILKGKKVTYGGTVYNSITELCRNLDINYNDISVEKTKGKTLEEAIKYIIDKKNNKKVTYKGVSYPNLARLCNDLNINKSSLRSSIDSGKTLEEAVDWLLVLKSKKEPIEFYGIVYDDLDNLCDIVGLSTKHISARLIEGIPLIEAIDKVLMAKLEKESQGKKSREIKYNGIEYPSLIELCRWLDIPISEVHIRKQLGYSSVEAVDYVVSKHFHNTYGSGLELWQ